MLIVPHSTVTRMWQYNSGTGSAPKPPLPRLLMGLTVIDKSSRTKFISAQHYVLSFSTVLACFSIVKHVLAKFEHGFLEPVSWWYDNLNYENKSPRRISYRPDCYSVLWIYLYILERTNWQPILQWTLLLVNRSAVWTEHVFRCRCHLILLGS